MTLYVMDTDHLSLFERRHPAVARRILSAESDRLEGLSITVVSMEEQMKGRLSQISRAAAGESLSLAYARLKVTFEMLGSFNVLSYDAIADNHFQMFRKAGVRIGTQDLRIASIVLASGGVLITRNRRDFEQVSGLLVEDWSVE